MKAIRLRTEYLREPLGIDITSPRLQWNCSGGRTQTAYQLICRDEKGEALWDSGKVKSGSMHAVYGGKPLSSRSEVHWQVLLWDENDVSGEWSEEASFELGLLSPDDFRAKWICAPIHISKKYRYPTDHFLREFDARDVIKARIYASACGLYTININGQKVSGVCAPGHTDYRRCIQYQTYDVTEQIKDGANVVTAELADGWYRGAQGAWGHTYIYGKRTKLLIQLELTHSDGSVECVCTDESWRWSNDGPRRFADLKEGEYVDARLRPTYGGYAATAPVKAELSCSDNVPVSIHERFTPRLIVTPSGRKVLDFSQNLSGFIGFRLKAHKGQRLFLRMGEMLDANGEFTQENIQLSMGKGERMEHICIKDGRVLNLSQFKKGKTTPLQMLEYIADEGENVYESEFALYGFRYALIETDIPFEAEDFYSAAVYSDLEETGSFTCSNELIDRFVKCTLWSEKSNSTDVPTDCPTRERSGWTGDAQIFFDTAAYLTDYQPFARKFVRDMTDRQTRRGKFHQIVPKGGEDIWMATMNGSVGWADAGVLIPYRMWKRYGDERIIRDNYDAMKRYAQFMMRRCGGWSILQKPLHIGGKYGKYLVNRGQSYGEWAEPDDVCPYNTADFIFPHPEESTAYTCFTLEHMEEIAAYLGHDEDAKLYRCYADGCRGAYQTLVRREKFSLDTSRQAKLVRPLYMDLLDEEQTAYAKSRLVRAMEDYGWRLGTGFLSTPFILYVLADIDIEYAYRLLENESCPGWLFMPKNGSTTVWEAWEGNSTVSKGIASLNHYSKGAMVSWLFDTVCGIRVSGENSFTIAPRPGGTLTHAGASYQSPYGQVESSWRRDDEGICYDVTVPANCTAQLILPDAPLETLCAGSYHFRQMHNNG